MGDGTRVLVTGAAGQLGQYLLASLSAAGYQPVGLGRGPGRGIDVEADIRDRAQLVEAVNRAQPEVIIHGAAYTDVDGCERDPDLAYAVNRTGAEYIASLAAERGIWLLGVGTDFVFPGDGGAPYAENAPTAPISAYGASKLAGEQAILSSDSAFAVARTAWVYGGRGKHFPRTVLTMLARQGGMEVVNDEIGSPTYAGDLAEGLVTLVPHRPSGILHLTNEGATSRFELARRVAAAAGRDLEAITPTSTETFLSKYPLPARRPANSALTNTRAATLGVRLPAWEDAVDRYSPTLAAEIAES